MNIFEQLQILRDLSAKVATDLQVSSAMSLIRRIRQADGSWNELKISPNPIIQEIVQVENDFESVSQIKGQVKQYSAKGISKKYQRSDLERQDYEYLIGENEDTSPELVSGARDVRIVCRIIEIKEQTLTWDLILEQQIGKQQWNVR